MKLGVVIPTRNRAELAILAIRALLAQPCDLQVLVSDNSTSSSEVETLAAFCDAAGDARLVRLRPPRELSMPAHWEWALRQATERFDSTHFTIHYDRKTFRPGHLALLTDLAARFPGELITYPSDYTGGDERHVTLWQAPATGRLYAIRTQRIAQLFAEGRWAVTAQAAPILANCVVPRATLDRIRARFGSTCDSIAPDSCFWFRFSALEERSLHFDRSLSVLHHAQFGHGYHYQHGDVAYFRKPFGDVPWLTAAPIPGLDLGLNALYHEYELVRRETGDRLPPIDRDGYLRDLASFIPLLPDPSARAGMLAVLRQHGFTEPVPPTVAPARPSWKSRLKQRLVRLAADHLGRAPRDLSGFAFRSAAQALREAMKYPRPFVTNSDYLSAVDPEPWPSA
jgi:hypothetical protein